MAHIVYRQINGYSPGFYTVIAVLGAIVLTGLGCAWYMEHNGHIVTGMNNQIVWGLPHVFAIFLIVAASGALNVASIASVFGREPYKPLSRLSGLLAMTLLASGLAILVLDLGRPDRLIVAMTKYNFKSIFAWNIFLYTGFLAIVGAYLYVQMAKHTEKYKKPVGLLAFVWRLALTTGTGSIFGWLVARQAYDAAIMAPLFIAMSFSFGLAIFIIVLYFTYEWTERPLSRELMTRLGRLLGVFAAAVLYFTAVHQLTNLYATEHHGIDRFILLDGGIYTLLFWGGQVAIGGVIPMMIVFSSAGKSRFGVLAASLLVILGGFAQLYVIVIGGQAYPLVLFPGYEVQSDFFDGVVNSYIPTFWELGLGLGGLALSLLLAAVGMAAFRFLPESLDDSKVAS